MAPCNRSLADVKVMPLFLSRTRLDGIDIRMGGRTTSQVATKSMRRTAPLAGGIGVALWLKVSARRSSHETGRNQRGMRWAFVQASHRSSTGAVYVQR